MLRSAGTQRRPLKAVVIVLAACVVADAGCADEKPVDAPRLSNLVRQDCGSCHGLTLNGGLGKPLTSRELAGWDRDQVASIILEGVPGTPMPPWRSLLSEAEAAWIAARLKEGFFQ